MQGRINIVENPDELLFANVGKFIPNSVEQVINQDSPQAYYRNRFLAEAMVNINIIDTIGSGIKKMFDLQRKRFFPLPDYDLKEEKVSVRIIGKIMNENYTRMLINNTDLGLDLVMLLDKVQKNKQITHDAAKILRKYKLIEGRYPNLFFTARIAALTGDKSTYIKNRAFDKQHYKQLIMAFIKQYGSASRKDIDNLLLDKLSDALEIKQKRKRFRIFLTKCIKRMD